MQWYTNRCKAALAATMLLSSSAAWAGTVNLAGGMAIQGYDPVAYFTQSEAVPGDPTITATYEGAIYRFASTADRELFVADPAEYVPEFGGFCAYGTAKGYKVPIDPQAFSIVDGKLYLNYDKKIWATFEQDAAGYIHKAEVNWPTVQQQPDPTN